MRNYILVFFIISNLWVIKSSFAKSEEHASLKEVDHDKEVLKNPDHDREYRDYYADIEREKKNASGENKSRKSAYSRSESSRGGGGAFDHLRTRR